MVTATLIVSPKRKNESLFDQTFTRRARRFHSKVTIRRGDSGPFDISSGEQLRELALKQSPDFVIVVEGKDEMKTAGALVDYFNHGLGI